MILLRGGLVDVGGGEFRRADVLVSDGRVAEVGDVGAPPTGDVVDCARLALVPGMVNAHDHSNENWLRGRFDNLPLEPWMLFSYPVLAAPPQSPEEIYVRTLLGGIEMLRTGATAVVDFLYELQGFTEESLQAVVRAYRDLGLRALIALAMADRAYHETVVLDARLVPAALIARLEREGPPAWDEWRDFARGAVERFHRPDEGISIGLAPSGPQRCTDELLTGCAELAEELDLGVHIHVLETRMQALSGRRMYGTTLPAHLDELGFLSPRISFAHGIWLTDDDMALVAERGVTIVHNPVSNLKLGSGIAPARELLDRGVNLALGTDGTCSNDGNDMLATLKTAALLHKVRAGDYERWPGAREAWRMATEGGGPAMNDRTLGRIAPGARADLVLLDLDALVFTPLNDPLLHICFSSAATAVRSVLVGGRWALRDGRITGVDEQAVLAEARELGPAVLARHDEAWDVGRQLLASVRAGWLEALEDVTKPARGGGLRGRRSP